MNTTIIRSALREQLHILSNFIHEYEKPLMTQILKEDEYTTLVDIVNDIHNRIVREDIEREKEIEIGSHMTHK